MKAKQVLVARYEAVGGPKDAYQDDNDEFPREPTEEGVFRIARCTQHSSDRYPEWSTFRWDSPIELRGDHLFVKHRGEWVDTETVGVSREMVLKKYERLYQRNEVPPLWVFNDFGHVTCYYYDDKNRNARQDREEHRKSDFIHTTPATEAAYARNKPIKLVESHGCIHVRPPDVDEMIERGYLAPNNLIEVHSYDAHSPFRDPPQAGRAPYEVHFFPGERALCVLGRPR